MLYAVDHEHVTIGFLRFELQSQLLLHGGEDRWTVGIDRGKPFAIERPLEK